MLVDEYVKEKKSGQIKTTSFPWWWKVAQSSGVFFMWFATLLSKSLHINLQASCLRSNRGALNIFWRRATCFCMQARHFELKFFTIKTFLKMVKLGRQNLAHSQPICSVPSPWWKLCWMKWKWICLGVSFPLALTHIPWASWNGEFYSALVPSDSALHSSRGPCGRGFTWYLGSLG